MPLAAVQRSGERQRFRQPVLQVPVRVDVLRVVVIVEVVRVHGGGLVSEVPVVRPAVAEVVGREPRHLGRHPHSRADAVPVGEGGRRHGGVDGVVGLGPLGETHEEEQDGPDHGGGEGEVVAGAGTLLVDVAGHGDTDYHREGLGTLDKSCKQQIPISCNDHT